MLAQTPQGDSLNSDELFKAGQQLFDQYAPPEVKEQYEFPSKAQWDAFAVKLQRALDGQSLEDLVALEPEARAALAATETIPGLEPLSEWLRSKIEDIEMAKRWLALQKALSLAPSPRVTPAPRPDHPQIPLYDVWLSKERSRPVPQYASVIMPRLKAAFEDKTVRIPDDAKIVASHRAIRKETTAAGNPRFVAERTAADHADYFWAHGLALEAAKTANAVFYAEVL